MKSLFIFIFFRANIYIVKPWLFVEEEKIISRDAGE